MCMMRLQVGQFILANVQDVSRIYPMSIQLYVQFNKTELNQDNKLRGRGGESMDRTPRRLK